MKPCNSCGKCCEYAGNGGLSATAEEIEWWEMHRPDIAAYVQDGNIWVDPATGKYFARCPFLRKSGNRTSCDIYHHRPEDCRHYPVDIGQMIRDDCEMLESSDLRNQKRAQQKLDAIMIDVRPAVRGR